MASHPAFDYSHLTIAERLQLVEELWDSIAADADAQTAHGSRTSQRRNAFKREFMMFNDHLVAKGSPG